ncbi:hypothetical protein O3P69_019724 [Scylla paramamosain]|uniref:Uncharacterized protein n=1 Tax=Scylla paramamosain TaxID=85552 RepID=A0AAW0SYC5_SCYPA
MKVQDIEYKTSILKDSCAICPPAEDNTRTPDGGAVGGAWHNLQPSEGTGGVTPPGSVRGALPGCHAGQRGVCDMVRK